MKYFDLISKSDEKRKKEELQDYVAEVNLQVQKDLLEARRAVSRAGNSLSTAKASYPFSTENYVEAQLDLKAAQETCSLVEEMYVDLFSDKKKQAES